MVQQSKILMFSGDHMTKKAEAMADKVFSCDPFGVQIAVFHCLTEMNRYFVEQLEIQNTEFFAVKANAMATVQADPQGIKWFAMWLPLDAPFSKIAHECSHMVDFVMDAHGVPINIENTEVRAYLLERMLEAVT